MVEYRLREGGYESDTSKEEENVFYHSSMEEIMRRAESYRKGARVRERLRRLGLAGDDGREGGPGEHEEEVYYEERMLQRFTTMIENIRVGEGGR